MKTSSLVGLPVIVAVGFMFALAAVVYTYYAPATNAQVQTETKEEEKTEESEEKADEAEQKDNEASENNVTYNYVAQPGDSYSKIARKAVQTYGLKHDVKLSTAQIIFAETNLTLEAGSPALSVDEEVSVSEADVKTWVERANDLDDETEAAWAVYAQGVEFNTDNVGERR